MVLRSLRALESETDDNRGYTITTSEENTLSIVVVAKGVTYTISCGTKSHTLAGSAPTSVVSYLPIGQFAQQLRLGLSRQQVCEETNH